MPNKDPKLPTNFVLDWPSIPTIGVCIPVYNHIGNENLAQAIWTIDQGSDLPYQLSLGLGPNCVAKNRRKAESRLDPGIELILQCDDDVLVPPFALGRMAAILTLDETIGVVSASMLGPRGEAQNDLHPEAFKGDIKECLPPGTCFMYNRKRTPIEWDVEYKGSQWEDTDAMMQVKKQGFRLIALRNVTVLHKNNWSENKWWNENRERFISKWPGVV